MLYNKFTKIINKSGIHIFYTLYLYKIIFISYRNMDTNKDLGILLTSIQKGLKVYSIKELNQAITKVLNKKSDRSEEIEYILSIVSNKFGITRNALMQSHKWGNVQQARRIAYCLLHFELELPYRKIAKDIFLMEHGVVQQGINYYRNLNLEVKADKDFYDIYLAMQEKLIEYINNKKI